VSQIPLAELAELRIDPATIPTSSQASPMIRSPARSGRDALSWPARGFDRDVERER
jgi:hypothetical protein